MATTTAKTTSAAPLAASGRLTAKDIVLLAVFGSWLGLRIFQKHFAKIAA